MSRRHHHFHHGHHHHNKYRLGRNWGKVLIPTFFVIVLGVMYLLLFNPNLPQGVLNVLSPVIYIIEVIIFILGLLLLNSFRLGRNDLGVWGFGILALILMGLGVFFFFWSGFVPRSYLGYEIWFGAILFILGLFAAFRTIRRYGSFVYLR